MPAAAGSPSGWTAPERPWAPGGTGCGPTRRRSTGGRVTRGRPAVALAAAFLNAAFGLCLGCEMYLLGLRLRTRSA
ncbi:DUF4395 family protein [Cellulomonas sp. zg-ZUI22]|uniref:DUF4395 family protein n=1 Tax=Cellulomonas sp. zg-ZUI22 TaxID=2816955 RepID=UPI001F5F1F57|nr:DUF4395 family protein [Cellulomonas sp. zg-ZUI22]